MSSPESFDLSGDLLLCDLAVVEALTQDFLFDVKDIRELWLLPLSFEDASDPPVFMELVLFVEFDLDGDFEGLEEADEDPKLLE